MTSIVIIAMRRAHINALEGCNNSHVATRDGQLRQNCYEELRKLIPPEVLEPRATVHLDPEANEHPGGTMPELLREVISDLWPGGDPFDLPVFDHTTRLYWHLAGRMADLIVNSEQLVLQRAMAS